MDNNQNQNYNYQQRGGINPLVVAAIVLTLLTIGLTAFGIWSYVNYQDQKNNVDQKVSLAVAEAKKKQVDADEAKFLEQEKIPTKVFSGPTDLGQVSFSYPKTWSSYINKLGSGTSSFEAYFQPGTVPPVDSKTPYALRVTIENKQYDKAISDYADAVKNGELRSSAVTVNGEQGNRLDGKIADNVQGIIVLFKVRDKTLKIYTESLTFQSDFENTVLKDLKFSR